MTLLTPQKWSLSSLACIGCGAAVPLRSRAGQVVVTPEWVEGAMRVCPACAFWSCREMGVDLLQRPGDPHLYWIDLDRDDRRIPGDRLTLHFFTGEQLRTFRLRCLGLPPFPIQFGTPREFLIHDAPAPLQMPTRLVPGA